MTVSQLVAVDPRRFDAVLFDLDGVVTDTAGVHAAAWRRLFDDALAARPDHPGEDHSPFTDEDYRAHIDGKPRRDGVRDFLASRGITAPEGDPDDTGNTTVHGLANRKQQIFLEALRDGVSVFPSTVALVDELRAVGIGAALYSASRNCRDVLRAAGVEHLFAVVVDGTDAERLGLAGKPDPAVLIEAARRLGALPSRCVVIEDAVAGIRAGRRGGFALVVGVDRTGSGAALREHGADAVVGDLSEIVARDGFSSAPTVLDERDCLVYHGYDPGAERLREALCTAGNGNFATRGCAPESAAGPYHYPGTYCAGVFNRLEDTVSGRRIDNESMVNLPNWLPLTFRVDGEAWFDIDAAEVLSYRQLFDLRCAELIREFRVRDAAGRISTVAQRRFVSMSDPHLAALQMTVLAENYSGTLEFRSAVDAGVRNSGVPRYHGLADEHLTGLTRGELGTDAVHIGVSTSQSAIPIAVGARTSVWLDQQPAPVQRRYLHTGRLVGHDISLPIATGETVTVEKTAMVVHGRNPAISEPGTHVRRSLPGLGRYRDLRAAHRRAWHRVWQRLDVELDGNTDELRVLRLHLLHLVQTLSPHTADLDVGVPARGLHGEAYRGHIFWDELFVLPVLNLRFPAITRSLLAYRYRRLPQARQAAREAGCRGAMFPWQSGSDGREESQQLHLNPMSGRWNPDASSRAHHVGIAVGYNVWNYFQTTGDREFLVEYGAELMVEIARFWVSLAQLDTGGGRSNGRYVIRGVIGPDEFHSGYPDRPHDGIDNNAYTNAMAAWVIARALDSLAALPLPDRLALLESLELDNAELARFDEVSRAMFIPFHDGVISQFEGYELLAELDWDDYRGRYDDIARLDRILEAEHDDVNRYRAGKQADVLMLFYLLSSDELRELFGRLGYPLSPRLIPDTIDYYLSRTSHGSTLSAVVHSWVLARSRRDQAMKFFEEVLRSDIDDIQGGTTAEGIHLAAMAGSVDLVQRCFTGLEVSSGTLKLSPHWPESLGVLQFSIQYRGHHLYLRLAENHVEVTAGSGDAAPITVDCHGRTAELAAGGSVRFS